MEDNRIEMEQLRLQVIQMAMEISSLRMTVDELAAGGEDGRANRLHHPVDELVSVKDGDKSSFIGEDNSHGVIRSGDGSISKTRVAPGGGVAPYVDLRVAPTVLPWADEVPPEIQASGGGKIGNKAEDANNDQEVAWEKHTHGCSQYGDHPHDYHSVKSGGGLIGTQYNGAAAVDDWEVDFEDDAPPDVAAASDAGNNTEAARGNHTHGCPRFDDSTDSIPWADDVPADVAAASALGDVEQVQHENHVHGCPYFSASGDEYAGSGVAVWCRKADGTRHWVSVGADGKGVFREGDEMKGKFAPFVNP